MFERLKNLFRPRAASGVFVGRRRTRDISFLAQSPAGFIGRIARSVPAPKITPNINDSTNPVPFYGLAVIGTSSNTVRTPLATDGSLNAIAGIGVAPFPFQASSATNYGAQALAALTAAPAGIIDVNRSGFQTVYCNSATAPNATLTSPVCVWIAATSGTHQQGGFEIAPAATVASAANVGNTGNGTLGTLSVTAGSAQNGAYQILFTAATTFTVTDANGRQLNTGKTGVAYSDGGVTFTITAGGAAFIAGDGFSVTVTNQTITLDSKSYFNGPGDSTGAIEIAFNS